MNSIPAGNAVLLGLVQGLTEFLPVSSSGHLVIFQNLLGFHDPQIFFDVVVHFGTLLAVVLVYGKDLLHIVSEVFQASAVMLRERNAKKSWEDYPYFRLAVYLVLGTLPAGFAGVLFDESLEKIFGSLASAGAMLLFTGTVLFSTRFAKGEGKDLKRLTASNAIFVGLAQAVALIPGISRSGMTIASGLFCGLNRDLAARFSFLLSVPAILGATVLQILKIQGHSESMEAMPFFVGGMVALATGYLALRFLLRVVHRGKLYQFSYYCWGLGTAVLLFSIFKT